MKRVITSLVSLCLAACLAFPAGALDIHRFHGRNQ